MTIPVGTGRGFVFWSDVFAAQVTAPWTPPLGTFLRQGRAAGPHPIVGPPARSPRSSREPLQEGRPQRRSGEVCSPGKCRYQTTAEDTGFFQELSCFQLFRSVRDVGFANHRSPP